MKTITTILIALATTATATAAFAQTAQGQPLPGYKARYDAARGLYCVRTTARAATNLIPTVVQKSCRTERQWAAVGLTFDRRAPRGEQLAQR
jgi:hypothetical protein